MFAHHVAMKRKIHLHRQSSSWGPTLKSKSSVLDSLKAERVVSNGKSAEKNCRLSSSIVSSKRKACLY